MKRFLILPLILWLSACQYITTLYNGVSRVTVILLDDRSFSDDMTDLRINLEIRDTLMRQDVKYSLDIEVTVFEGVVLLNGALPSADLIDQVLSVVWSVNGVRKVFNYIRIAQPLSLDEVNQDAAISAKIRMELSLTRGISSSNYKIIMENGVVYVFGIAKDETELMNALGVIKDTPGVNEVVLLTRWKNASKIE